MYPFNYLASQQDRICFQDYGLSSGRWCGSRRQVSGVSGYFESGGMFLDGKGLKKTFAATEFEDFTIESWVNTSGTGLLFKAGDFQYGLGASGYFFQFKSGGATGHVMETGWEHNALSITNADYYSSNSGFLEDFGRYRSHLTGEAHFTNGYFGSGLSGLSSLAGQPTSLTSSVGSYSIQFWVKLDTWSADTNMINIHFGRSALLGNSLITVQDYNSTPESGLAIFYGGSAFSSAGSQYVYFQSGDWQHIAFTVNQVTGGKIVSGYKNGAFYTSGLIADDILFIDDGKKIDISIYDTYSKSACDELVLYSGALSSGEVYTNFNQEIQNPEGDERILHYYKFDSSGELIQKQNYSFCQNGLITQSGSISGSSNLSLGSASIGAGLSGKLDEFRLWSGARGSGEIYQYWDESLTEYPSFAQSGLHSYLRFEAGEYFLTSLYSGLVEFWPMNETGGLRSGRFQAKNLTEISGSVGSTDGIRQKAAYFTGTTTTERHLRSTDTAFNFGDTQFTIALWGRRHSEFPYFVSKQQGSVNASYEVLGYSGGAYLMYYRAGPVVEWRQPLKTNPSGQWGFYCLWHDSVANEVGGRFQDIEDIASYSLGVASSTAPLRVGMANGTSDRNCDVFNVGMWNRVLTKPERDWLYNNGNGRLYSGITPS